MADFIRKYASAANGNIIIPIIKTGSDDFAVAADWTPAAGDVKISIDGAAAANIATLPVYVTNVGWKFVFSGDELTGKFINVNIKDQDEGKVIKDQHITISTYGSPNAGLLLVLGSTGLPIVNVDEIDDSATAPVVLRYFMTNGIGTDDRVKISANTQDLSASLSVNAKAIAGSTAAATAVSANIANLDAAVSTRSTFNKTTEQVIVATNNDKTGYALTTAEKNSIVDLVWDELQSGHTTTGTFGKFLDGDKTGFALSTTDKNTLVDLIWDELQAGHTTASTFGKYLDAQVSLSGTALTSQQIRDALKLAPTAGTPAAGSVDEHLDDILADTNETQGKLPTNKFMGSSTAANKDTTIDAIKTVTDLIPNGGAMTTIQNDVVAIYNKLPTGTISDFDEATNNVTVGTNNDKTGYALTTAEKNSIIDLVWDELQSGHTTTGTFGKYLDSQISAIVGGTITAQQVRDALKLAPTAGTPATGSVDDHLDNINSDTDAIVAKLPTGTISDFDETIPVIVGRNDDKTGYEILGAKSTLDELNDISTANVDSTISANTHILNAESKVASIFAKLPNKDYLAAVDNAAGNIELDDTTGALPAGAFLNMPDVDLNNNQSGVTIGTVNALGTQAKADVHAEIDTVINVEEQEELLAGTPPTVESIGRTLARVRMALVNQGMQTADYKTFYNAAGTPIWKKEISSRDPYIEKKGVSA